MTGIANQEPHGSDESPTAAEVRETAAPVSHGQILAAGLGMVKIIILLLAVMLVTTGGHLTRAYEIVLLVGIALVTGISFWLLTPGSTGTVEVKEIGIRLGGGAAIGAAFMILAWWLTSGLPSYVVVPVPASIPSEFVIRNLTPEEIADVGEVHTITNNRMLYVAFQPKRESGTIELRHLKPGEAKFSAPLYIITVKGEISPGGTEK